MSDFSAVVGFMLVIIFSIMILVLGISAPLTHASCVRQAQIMERAHKWDIMAGCYIQADSGKFIPADAFGQADVNLHSVK